MSKEQKKVASLCPEAMTDSVASRLDGRKVEIVSARFIDRPTRDETKSFAVLEVGYGVLDADGEVEGEPVIQGYSIGETSPKAEWQVSEDGNSVYDLTGRGIWAKSNFGIWNKALFDAGLTGDMLEDGGNCQSYVGLVGDLVSVKEEPRAGKDGDKKAFSHLVFSHIDGFAGKKGKAMKKAKAAAAPAKKTAKAEAKADDDGADETDASAAVKAAIEAVADGDDPVDLVDVQAKIKELAGDNRTLRMEARALLADEDFVASLGYKIDADASTLVAA